ncbi:MAG: DUF2142 domain-containing protein [Anaerolineae bacterium]
MIAPMDALLPRSVVLLLVITVVAYLAIGILYAALTPTWQVPDEPAHYNYTRSLAEGLEFPVLERSDYDQDYLRHLTSGGFPPELSIQPLEYEDHQPPLFYLLAMPIYVLFRGEVLPLRLISVGLGAALLLVAFGTWKAIFPRRPELALMGTAFVAFIPQHVAMTAGINNDTLAELVVGGTLWTLMLYLRTGSTAAPGYEPPSLPRPTEERPWQVGLLLAAALMTKTTAYVTIAVAIVAVAIRWWREQRPWHWAARQLAWMLVPALLLSAPWFLHNARVYGWTDPLALARHNAVVQGQPRSSEWLASYGWRGLLSRMALTTFHSFWGQFGWMAVPLPSPVYRGLAVLSAILVVGFVLWLVTGQQGRRSIDPLTCQRLSVLAISALLTISAYIWYNLTFVQHQGRYLFPALIPLATAAALGLDKLAAALPKRLRGWVLGLLFTGLATFSLYCLFRVVIPNLAR